MSSISIFTIYSSSKQKIFVFMFFFSKQMLKTDKDNDLIIMLYYHYLYILECNDKKLNSLDKKNYLYLKRIYTTYIIWKAASQHHFTFA